MTLDTPSLSSQLLKRYCSDVYNWEDEDFQTDTLNCATGSGGTLPGWDGCV